MAAPQKLSHLLQLADQGPALRAALPFWFPRVNEIIRLIGSHNVLATPTAAALGVGGGGGGGGSVTSCVDL